MKTLHLDDSDFELCYRCTKCDTILSAEAVTFHECLKNKKGYQ